MGHRQYRYDASPSASLAGWTAQDMSASTLPTQLTTVLGLRTRYLVRGSGPPVLVLHGWGASIEAVNPIVTGLAPVATVYALDLPGHGQSALPPEPWGVAEYQAFVVAFMDELEIERPAIVGVREARCETLRLQEHPRGHVPVPGLHRLPEDPRAQAAGAKVGCDREPVRPGPDDDDVLLGHAGSPRAAPGATRWSVTPRRRRSQLA